MGSLVSPTTVEWYKLNLESIEKDLEVTMLDCKRVFLEAEIALVELWLNEVKWEEAPGMLEEECGEAGEQEEEERGGMGRRWVYLKSG